MVSLIIDGTERDLRTIDRILSEKGIEPKPV